MTHRATGVNYAAKCLEIGLIESTEALRQLRDEIFIMCQLDHPNIVRAMDAREIKGTRFLVMEYVEGINLSDLVRRHGPLRVPDACELIRQAALGLEAHLAHAAAHAVSHHRAVRAGYEQGLETDGQDPVAAR